jgi:hypothetical protein
MTTSRHVQVSRLLNVYLKDKGQEYEQSVFEERYPMGRYITSGPRLY